ncbi:MAG: hypothetical protein F9K24_04625 [Leptonema illini]|uniref:Uncharacterized protein n=1 Tax=Leptonema illini TaxID=183 RepID=A0A833H3R2_9LEPT|nr:MAG: hypothetical protein F9K24_04625 [Leptonema illini]PKL32178.1 MAG: hypothetical protein CVV45_14055 [Spirochaetae bacterium HGW-Spirochaetae-10]
MRRILLILVILSSCTLGIDGDETVSAGEAARTLQGAVMTNTVRCHPGIVQGEKYTGNIFALTQALCMDASDPYLLLRRSDVEGCADRISVLPCQGTTEMTIFYSMILATNCPIEIVQYAFNNVSHPLQGNIMTGARDGLFWYSCL